MADLIEPLEVLWEAPGLPAFALPEELQRLYGGTLGFEEPRVFANFVASVDGVTAIPSLPGSNKLIAAASASDRFVMGLLRACADVIAIGSGTLAASPRGLWTTEQAYPPAAAGFSALREQLGRPPQPGVVVLTASGRVDPAHPAFAAGAVALTTDAGAARLAGVLPSAQILPLGEELHPAAVLDALHGRGQRLILCEGGPTALGPFLQVRLIDELFLTISPLLTGRTGDDPRLGLVEEADLLDARGALQARLLGVRRDGDHLFLRYQLDTKSPGGTPPAET